MKKIVLAASLAVSFAVPLLAGCDQQQSDEAMNKLKAFFNSVKPDELLLKDLKPGETTEAQIRDQMGKPETERTFTDGSKRFEYPRGPAGTTTWFVDLDSNGRFVSATQVLTAQNIAKVRLGMTMDEVRRLLGKPTQIAEFPLKKERVWSWHWLEDGVNRDAMFNAHFGPDGTVVTTSRSDTGAGRGR
ncbi:putative lipoprotein [Candidatus Burkholderia verschuerenii]|uniref:Putative lipoprotein n=1 Tax=Candidatus Burkholderia verschuerenii TaxID=242163 RepID=A0A0L0MHK7_9BURK|nr:outer membrane protein assembly factor BamE [Candidatus Burkholderia verschuerenii]KND62157.1 putative lipoprotein [Candidatus Burkholderia verschuerenii]